MNKSKVYKWSKNFILNNNNFFNDNSYLDLTIIIFTFKRPECVVKSITYWANRSPKIIIVDGSPDSLDQNYLDFIKKIKNILYFHLPKKTIPERIKYAFAKAKSKFIMCQADDDFYLFSGLEDSIKQLEEKKYLVSCMGQSMGLDFKNLKPYFFEYGSNLKNFKINSVHVNKRLNKGFKNYIPAAFYAVFRAKSFKSIWKNIKNNSCLEMYEYEHAIRTYLEGGLDISKKKYWVRTFKYKPQNSNIDGNRKITFEKWLINKKYKKERKNIINQLSKKIKNKLNINDEKSILIIKKIFKFLKNNKNSLYKNYSLLFKFIIFLKKKFELTFFSYFIEKFKSSKPGQIFIETVIYLSREKNILIRVRNKRQKLELEKLMKFLQSYPI